MARGFGYKVYIQPILQDYIDYSAIALHTEAKTAIGVGGFVDISTLQPQSAAITPRNLASGVFTITVGGSTLTITNAVLTSNVATITLSATHSILVGALVTVAGLTSTFAPLNGTYTVTAVTSTTLSYAKTNANISTGAASGTLFSGSDLLLDGTDKPFRLFGLESGAPQESVKSESNPTWDDETQGAEVSEPVSSANKIAFKGKTNYTDSAYKVLRLVQKYAVSKNLAAKILKIGPTGYTETVFGFGRFVGFKPEDDAGKIVKWSSDFEFDGPSGLILHT